MAVIRRDALVEMCAAHLGAGEDVRECVEATVVDVNGRRDATADVDRVLVALTGPRLLTLVWRGGPEPVLDGAVPIGFVAGASVDDAAVGVVLTVSLTTGAAVRFAVGAAQEREAWDLACALGPLEPALGEPPGRSAPAAMTTLGPTTEELPVVGASRTAATSVQLAAEIAALCERNRGRILELTPGLVVSPTDDGASTYYVHVAPPARAQGGCPRCEHVNRDGAVFCVACGALL